MCSLSHCDLPFLITSLQLPYSVESNGYFPILILIDLLAMVETVGFPFPLATLSAFGFHDTTKPWFPSNLLATPVLPLHSVLFNSGCLRDASLGNVIG